MSFSDPHFPPWSFSYISWPLLGFLSDHPPVHDLLHSQTIYSGSLTALLKFHLFLFHKVEYSRGVSLEFHRGLVFINPSIYSGTSSLYLLILSPTMEENGAVSSIISFNFGTDASIEYEPG